MSEVNAMTPVTQADIDAALVRLDEIACSEGVPLNHAAYDHLRNLCTALIDQRDADAAAVLSQTERLRVAVDDRMAETARADKAERKLRELGEVVR